MSPVVRPLAAVLLAALLIPASALGAQSIYSAAGLGLPSEPLDGRARALGSFGIGLTGSSLQVNDPAAAGRIGVPRATIVAQPSWVEYERGTDAGRFRGNRFPAVAVGYPLASGLATLSFSTTFEQRFSAERVIQVELISGTRQAQETFDQEGALSHVQMGYARSFLDGSLSLGALVGRNVGSLGSLLTRDFTAYDSLSTIGTYRRESRWSYSGWTGTLGAAADVVPILRLAVSATWSQDLRAAAQEGTTESDRYWGVPARYRGGFSLALSSGLQLAGSAVYADWSQSSTDLAEDVTASSSFGYGIGIELTRGRLFGRGTPLRLGYRSSRLPFAFTEYGNGGGPRGPDSEAAVETVFAGGIGFPLAGSEELTLASADLAVERGRRQDFILSESFWRVTVSLSVSGF